MESFKFQGVLDSKSWLLLLFCNLIYPVGFAEEVLRKDESWTVGLVIENDLTSDTDKNYTSGVRLSWISPDLTGYKDSQVLPEWSLPVVNAIPFINESGLQRNVGIAIGQKIFTPEDILSQDLIKDDRPYAGWLYLSMALHSKSITTLDTLELQLGVVGPAALGRESQNSIHRFRGLKEAQGWSHQLENEPGIVLLYERKWRAFQAGHKNALGTDLIAHGGATVGKVSNYANAGLEWRFGWHLPTDFGTSLIRPGGDATGATNANDPRFSDDKRFGIYAFAAVSGRLVLRDIFLDGNSFKDSHSVNKEAFVGDLIVGGSVIVQGVKVSYAQVFRGKEF